MTCIVMSSTKGFQSSPDLVERKKSTAGKKVSIESSRLAALPVTTNKTVFFLPGVDIKVFLFIVVLLMFS